MKVTAAGTLWVRPEHVGSMATTTTDDLLAVYDDAAVGAVTKLNAPAIGSAWHIWGTSRQVLGALR